MDAVALVARFQIASGIMDPIVEAVRQILLQLQQLQNIGVDLNRLDRIRRETIFFLYEGGNAAKFDPDRPHSTAARAHAKESIGSGRRFHSHYFPIVYDHAIPLKLLRTGLTDALVSHDALASFLRRYVQGVIITQSEDQRLTSMRLRSSMPDNASLDDLFARYRAADIPFEPSDIALLQRNAVA